MISRCSVWSKANRLPLRKAFCTSGIPSDLKDLVLKNYSLSEKDKSMAEKSTGQIKISARGKGGKNEIGVLPYVVDQALVVNSSARTSAKLNVMTGPISIVGNPHLGVMANTLIRDAIVRFEMMRGKRVTNRVRRTCLVVFQCHGSRLEASFAANRLQEDRIGDVENDLRDYITAQLKSHLQSFYRWGVLIDQKDIELTLGGFP